MSIWKAYAVTLLEIVIFLFIGFILTENVLRVVYGNLGIRFNGNVWVNWFGVSYILFVTYTIVRIVISKNNFLIKERTRSILFWLLFLGSIVVVFIPFIIGRNPF
ncbi:magnesium-transporting ATPase (P-type) [Metabacillus crassostreae]|uniref:hypothetical protein n=1 Tax=Metabacillus crassostreae TaxID=929098 RepID=UPI00195A6E8C|nr:hypothetical protein [Metabacillus crassostreae]MBM7602597.1 magnesium-transporting ATPase (P-type) [Metabacillus crassostreae]